MGNDEAIERVARTVAAYRRGVFTSLEAADQVLDCITSSNAAAVASSLPEELVRRLRSMADAAPQTDAEWAAAKYVYIRHGCHIAGHEPHGESASEQREEMEQWKQRHRLRVEALRRCFSKGA